MLRFSSLEKQSFTLPCNGKERSWFSDLTTLIKHNHRKLKIIHTWEWAGCTGNPNHSNLCYNKKVIN